MKNILCLVNKHDWKILPSPPDIMGGIFSPRRCNRCGREEAGFPYPEPIENHTEQLEKEKQEYGYA